MAAAALCFAAFSNAQVDPSRVVATVNGEQIKGGEYYHRMEFLPGVTKRYGDQSIESPPGFLTMVELIGEKLVLQLAKEKGVMPNQQEVDDELKLRLGDNPKYVENWAATGQTREDLDNRIRFELAKFKLQTLGITVTDQEVQKYYKENPSVFTSEKAVKVRIIAVDDDTSAVDADLKAGKDFAAVARDKSMDVTRGVGGDLGTVPISFLPENARNALNSIKIGGTTPWMDVNKKKVKYQLVDVLPAKLQPLDSKMMISTRRILMLDRGRDKNHVDEMINAMRAKSKIVISQKEFADLYQQLVSAAASPK